MKARTLCSLLAALLWLWSARVCFSTDRRGDGRALVLAQERALARGKLDAQREQMQLVNPEWDFMGRTFLALSIVNQALTESHASPEHARALERLLRSTLDAERSGGNERFMLGYVRDGAFRDAGARSVFIDGELALMLAARQHALCNGTVSSAGVEADAFYAAELSRRIERIVAQLEAGPVLSGESYPNECWTFCNTTALAAIRVYDATTGEDHGELLRRWVAMARARLIDPSTGMLISSYQYDGTHLDGPEGSTLWMTAHNLLIVDPAFAREQYALAKRYLARSFGGFGWAREWRDYGHPADVDSGPVIPGLEISAASSGLAIVGAGAFDDREYMAQLARSLDFAGVPVMRGEELHYATSNQVADAVIAYGFSQGALWRAVGAPTGAAR